MSNAPESVNKSTNPTSLNTAKTPTSFLSLPHELRQQILLENFDLVANLPSRPSTSFQWPRRRNYHLFGYHRIKDWGINLRSIYDGIVEDVVYAEEHWVNRVKQVI